MIILITNLQFIVQCPFVLEPYVFNSIQFNLLPLDLVTYFDSMHLQLLAMLLLSYVRELEHGGQIRGIQMTNIILL